MIYDYARYYILYGNIFRNEYYRRNEILKNVLYVYNVYVHNDIRNDSLNDQFR